jgi:hypothetical protein
MCSTVLNVQFTRSLRLAPIAAAKSSVTVSKQLALSIAAQIVPGMYLERAFDERSFWMPFLNVDPLFDSLRADPRFRDLLGRIGLLK